MNPCSRAAKILAASAALSKKPHERDALNSSEILIENIKDWLIEIN